MVKKGVQYTGTGAALYRQYLYVCTVDTCSKFCSSLTHCYGNLVNIENTLYKYELKSCKC